jgi:signal transduction histidine kinase
MPYNGDMPSQEAFQILAIIANQNVVRNLKDLLQGTSFKLEVTPTPKLGTRMAEEILPDVILLDMDSEGSALETCRHLRTNRILQGTPVLMLCDHKNRDSRALGLSAGVDDFINKPFDDIELLSRLRTITRLNAKRMMVTDLTRFTWMASHAADGYVLLDKSGGIHYANENARALLNLPSDYLGLPFVAVVEHRFTAEPEEAWANWISDPVPLFLVQPETPTARANWVLLDSLDTMLGRESHRIVRIKDVTERMSIYQDMRRFHTVVTHKLRTPMSVMFNNLSIIKNKMEMLSPDEIKDYVASSIENAYRLVDEIRQILSYIHAPLALSAGEAVMLNALPEIVEKLCQELKLEKVKLSASVELGEIRLALTQEALEMILHELFENSQKFHPAHDPCIEISLVQTKTEFINLYVKDDGLTLSPEQLSWAWLPYVQGEKDFTGELPGMGLGFPMVATLIWKAGGDLWLRNRHDGPGVIVELKIPLESTARKFERPAAPYQR